MWTPLKISPLGPVYVAIAEALARDVRAGVLQPGERLPTHRDLARQLGVNVVTITRAYGEAARRGLVAGEVGRGTFVRAGDETPLRADLAPTERDEVDFHFNLPVGEPELLEPELLFRELAGDGARSPLFAGYTATGERAHRQAGARWMERAGLTVDADRVIVCGGAQHAMTTVLATVAAPGDTLLLGALTYPGARALAGLLHLRTHGVAMDGSGLLPDALEAACRKTGARVLYCMPTTQNPTGITMPADRRRELCAVARKYGLAVIEDDSYGPFEAHPPEPLAALAPERTYFIAGTSKSLTAGLRIAWLAAPEGEPTGVERLASTVAATSWMAAPLSAEIAARWIASGAADRAVAWKRREARARRKLFEKLVPALASASHAASPHVWTHLPEPWRGAEFALQARRRGVALTGAEAFCVGRADAPHAVRLCLGTPTGRGRVEEGLRVLGGILAGVPAGASAIV